MILADSSIWADHLRAVNSTIIELLARNVIAIHPLVIGEVALGSLDDRQAILEELWALPKTAHVRDQAVFAAIEADKLFACGIGWVDTVLLLSVRSTQGCALWTFDRRLGETARRLGVRVV